jgi:hypothetical protein
MKLIGDADENHKKKTSVRIASILTEIQIFWKQTSKMWYYCLPKHKIKM